jgi:hypothetical protein
MKKASNPPPTFKKSPPPPAPPTPCVQRELSGYGGWISVEEKLPPTGNFFYNCIICKQNKVVMEAMWNGKTKHFQNRDFSDLNHFVTHWMPLPKAP